MFAYSRAAHKWFNKSPVTIYMNNKGGRVVNKGIWIANDYVSQVILNRIYLQMLKRSTINDPRPTECNAKILIPYRS